jgi:hypothetical protein
MADDGRNREQEMLRKGKLQSFAQTNLTANHLASDIST